MYEKIINKLDYTHKFQQIIERYQEIVVELEMDEIILEQLKNWISQYNNKDVILLLDGQQ